MDQVLYKQIKSFSILLLAIGVIAGGCTARNSGLSVEDKKRIEDAENKAKAAEKVAKENAARDAALKEQESDLTTRIQLQVDAEKRLQTEKDLLIKDKQDLDMLRSKLEAKDSDLHLTKEQQEGLNAELNQRQQAIDQRAAEIDEKTRILNERSIQLQKEADAVKSSVAAEDKSFENLLKHLAVGEAYPLLVVVWGDGTIANLAQVKALITKTSAENTKNMVRSDENRVEGHPSGRYLLSIDSVVKYNELKEYIRKNTKFTLVEQAVNNIKIKSFIKLVYTKTGWGNQKTLRIPIGESGLIPVGLNYQNMNLENATALIGGDIAKFCTMINASCFKALAQAGYFKFPTEIEGTTQKPIDYLVTEIPKTLKERNSGNVGGNYVWGSEVIANVILEHEVWVEGLPKELGLGQRIGSATQGNIELSKEREFYASPIKPRASDISVENRGINRTLMYVLDGLIDGLTSPPARVP